MGLILGVCFSIGQEFYATMGLMDFARGGMWLRALAYGLACAIVLLGVMWLYDWIPNRLDGGSRLSVWLASLSSARRRLLLTALVFVLLLPAFLAFYPGGYASDAPGQLMEYFNLGLINAHFPAAHTLVLVGCFQIGQLLFGSYDAGLSLFCILQMALIAYALAFSADRMVRWGASPVLVLVMVVLIGLNPVVQYFSVTTAKDSLFAPFFLICLTYLADILRNRDDSWLRPGQLVGYLMSAAGLCLMRKQGLYILIVATLVSLPALRCWGRRFSVVLSLTGALVVTSLFNLVVGAAFVTVPDSVREVLSVPSQQVARTYMLCHDELTDDQLTQIGTYYDLDALEVGRTTSHPWGGTDGIGSYYDTEVGEGYLEPLADPSKAQLKTDAYEADTTGYWSMWASLSSGHEGIYLESFLWGGIGYVYPTSSAANRWSVMVTPWNEFGWTLAGNDQVSDYAETSLFPQYRDWLVDGGLNFFSDYSLGALTSPAVPFLVMALALTLLLRQRSHMIFAWLMGFIYWGSLWLGPVMCVRYVFPLFLCVPVFLVLPILKPRNMSEIHGDTVRDASLGTVSD